MKKSSTETDPLNEEMDTDVNLKQTPEIHILKGKKRLHKRDGCNGGGGGVGVGVGVGGAGIGYALAGLAGDPPGFDIEIVKAARDIPSGAIIKAKDLEDISAKRYMASGGKVSKDMLTRSMAKDMSTTKMIPKGTLLKVNMLTRK